MATATQEQLDAFNSAIASGDYQSAYNMGTAAGFSADDLAAYTNLTHNSNGQFGTGITGDYLTGQFGGGAQQAFAPEPQNSFTQTAAQAASTPTWNATTAGAGGLPPNVTQGGLSKFQGLINAGQFQDAYNMGSAAGYSANDLAKYVNQNWNGQFGNLTDDYLTNMYGGGKGPNGPDYSTLAPHNPSDPYNLNNKGPNGQYASGWGGYQPAGSPFAGDNPMPDSYRQQLPALNATTTNAINAAMNIAMDAAKRNGYDPEKSNAINVLRGFYSDDPARRAAAIQAAGNTLASKGASTTADYGVWGIRMNDFSGLNTSAPQFGSAYDKNWDRPTLYDMINSSMGWEPGSPNYADPKNRTAALNRKLTDEEIRLFQDNPGAAAERFKTAAYGGAVPGVSYAPSNTGAAGATGAIGGSSGGLIGSATGGSAGQPGMQSAQSGYSYSYNPGQPHITNVDPAMETVEQRIASLVNPENPVNQRIATAIKERANARGLLNSSMAEQATQAAIIDNAQGIANADAQTYTQTRFRNQDALNEFSRAAQAHGFNMETLGQNFANDFAKMDKQFSIWKDQLGATRANDLQDKYMNGVGAAQNQFAQMFSNIQNSNMDEGQKTAALQQAQILRDNTLSMFNSMFSNMPTWSDSYKLLAPSYQ